MPPNPKLAKHLRDLESLITHGELSAEALARWVRRTWGDPRWLSDRELAVLFVDLDQCLVGRPQGDLTRCVSRLRDGLWQLTLARRSTMPRPLCIVDDAVLHYREGEEPTDRHDKLRAIVADVDHFLTQPDTVHDCEFTRAVVRVRGIFARLARLPGATTIALGGDDAEPAPPAEETEPVEPEGPILDAVAEEEPAVGWRWRSIVTDEHVSRENLIDVGAVLADALGRLVEAPAGDDALEALPYALDDAGPPTSKVLLPLGQGLLPLAADEVTGEHVVGQA